MSGLLMDDTVLVIERGDEVIVPPMPPEPLRRRMRVRFGDAWTADSEDVVLLREPGHYAVAHFPLGDIAAGLVSFEADKAEVTLDGARTRDEPGQSVIAHGADGDLSLDGAPPGGRL